MSDMQRIVSEIHALADELEAGSNTGDIVEDLRRWAARISQFAAPAPEPPDQRETTVVSKMKDERALRRDLDWIHATDSLLEKLERCTEDKMLAHTTCAKLRHDLSLARADIKRLKAAPQSADVPREVWKIEWYTDHRHSEFHASKSRAYRMKAKLAEKGQGAIVTLVEVHGAPDKEEAVAVSKMKIVRETAIFSKMKKAEEAAVTAPPLSPVDVARDHLEGRSEDEGDEDLHDSDCSTQRLGPVCGGNHGAGDLYTSGECGCCNHNDHSDDSADAAGRVAELVQQAREAFDDHQPLDAILAYLIDAVAALARRTNCPQRVQTMSLTGWLDAAK